VVVPDAYKLTDKFRDSLVEYAKNGGSLVLLGQKCARLFESHLGVELAGDPRQVSTLLAAGGGVLSQNGVWQPVKPTTASAIGYRYPTAETRSSGDVAATVATCGKGRIAAVFGPVGVNFLRSHHPRLRQFIGEVVANVFPNPSVRVDGPPCLDIALRTTRDGKLSVHLMNAASAPTSEDHCAIDYIPTTGPVTVKVDVDKKPKAVRWVPDGGKPQWSWSRGVLTAILPGVHIHGIMVIE
jgi:hypothetical protein